MEEERRREVEERDELFRAVLRARHRSNGQPIPFDMSLPTPKAPGFSTAQRSDAEFVAIHDPLETAVVIEEPIQSRAVIRIALTLGVMLVAVAATLVIFVNR